MFRVQPCASVPGRQPCRTYYQVLGISPDERDPRVIEEAALGCSCHARTYQLRHESECTLRLNEIAQALSTLLDPVRRREYDWGLHSLRRPAAAESWLSPPRTAIWGEGTLVLVAAEGKACDVELVYRECVPRQRGCETVCSEGVLLSSHPSPPATPLSEDRRPHPRHAREDTQGHT